MQAILKVLNERFALDCEPHERRRLEDLAAALEARLAGFTGDADAMRRLVLVALALMDETQATGAALARARSEIDRLSDMVAEAGIDAARPAPDPGERGRVGALRAKSAA